MEEKGFWFEHSPHFFPYVSFSTSWKNLFEDQLRFIFGDYVKSSRDLQGTI